MRQLFVVQNTLQWHQERMTRPTASEFDRIITSGGKPSEQSRRYMYELIYQRIYGTYACPSLETAAMMRGKQLEAPALQRFCEQSGYKARTGHFLMTDDGRVGCSPDAIIGSLGVWECVEIKAPDPWKHMLYSVEGPLRDYKAQLQGLMLVGEFQRVHFYSYHPDMPCVVHTIERDEPFIAKLAELLVAFVAELDAKEAEVRALGNYGSITRELATPSVGASRS